jgi:hypothetical protein
MDDVARKEQGTAHEESISPPVAPQNDLKPDAEDVKRDKHGFPLVPQPSDNSDDPLVRPH